MNQPDRPDLINSVLYMYIFCQNKNNKFRKERSKGHTKCVATIKVQSCVKAVTDIHTYTLFMYMCLNVTKAFSDAILQLARYLENTTALRISLDCIRCALVCQQAQPSSARPISYICTIRPFYVKTLC